MHGGVTREQGQPVECMVIKHAVAYVIICASREMFPIPVTSLWSNVVMTAVIKTHCGHHGTMNVTMFGFVCNLSESRNPICRCTRQLGAHIFICEKHLSGDNTSHLCPDDLQTLLT